MSHQVLIKREVPVSEQNITLTGKIVTTKFLHGGEKAVCVRVANGMSAWGFGLTWDIAEQNAVDAAMAF